MFSLISHMDGATPESEGTFERYTMSVLRKVKEDSIPLEFYKKITIQLRTV